MKLFFLLGFSTIERNKNNEQAVRKENKGYTRASCEKKMCIVENVKIRLAPIPVIRLKKRLPVLYMIKAVNVLKIKDGSLTDNSPNPNSLMQMCRIKK